MTTVLAIVLSAAFGAGDQYLGSLAAHPWGAEVSLLSAPWLAVAFIAGCTQPTPRRAAAVGLACTLAALLGYALLTLSPLENAQLTARSLRGFVISESRVVLGGLVTGPLLGWLGHRWRTQRRVLGPLILGLALCLEPLAHELAGSAIGVPAVWIAELAIGAAIVAHAAACARARGPV